MLSADDNAALTEVDAGTPMGALLRRYWWPVAAVGELAARATKAVRLLGEDLVLYRAKDGGYGLIERHCPHRGGDLTLGMVESDGIRCSYHGWCFDRSGACVDQPFERAANPGSTFHTKVRATAYRAAAKAGLVWAYLGPEPAPCLWDWERFHARAFKTITFTTLACNWLQCQENAIDPVHFEWLHENYGGLRGGLGRGQRNGRDARAPGHVALAFEEFEHGFVYRRELAGQGRRELWDIGRVCLWPNALYVGDFMWSVPIDRISTLHVTLQVRDLPGSAGSAPYEQAVVPHWHAPLVNPKTGRPYTRRTGDQDFAMWLGQGVVVDRTREHLGASDRGIILLRQRFAADVARVARSGSGPEADPKNVLRDGARNHRLPLPLVPRPVQRVDSGITGEPPEIAAAYDDAWATASGQSPAVARAVKDAKARLGTAREAVARWVRRVRR